MGCGGAAPEQARSPEVGGPYARRVQAVLEAVDGFRDLDGVALAAEARGVPAATARALAITTRWFGQMNIQTLASIVRPRSMPLRIPRLAIGIAISRKTCTGLAPMSFATSSISRSIEANAAAWASSIAAPQLPPGYRAQRDAYCRAGGAKSG